MADPVTADAVFIYHKDFGALRWAAINHVSAIRNHGKDYLVIDDGNYLCANSSDADALCGEVVAAVVAATNAI